MELSSKEKRRAEYRALIEELKNMDVGGLLSAQPDLLDGEDEHTHKSRGEDWSEA